MRTEKSTVHFDKINDVEKTMEGNGGRNQNPITECLDEALDDPNLTHSERRMVSDMYLRAMDTARKSAIQKETWGKGFERCLQQEMLKWEVRVRAMRGRAANRKARRHGGP